ERRHGQQSQKMIKRHQIDRIKYKHNSIKIYSKEANMWNGNGIITIPKEVEQYALVKENVQAFEKGTFKNLRN
ncbi:MAG: hypothetical protein AAGK97_04070, partial [Bacteroidota bacterium]